MEFFDKIKPFKDGKIVLIYDKDGREEETDLTIVAEKITPQKIAFLRKNAGGLICLCIHPYAANKLEIPYLSDVYESAKSQFQSLKMFSNTIPYDTNSSFSLSINHVKTYTGITDNDRALTISEMSKYVEKTFDGTSKKEIQQDFASQFRIPGHVPLLIGNEKLIKGRDGHTELALSLSAIAKENHSVVICEMLDEHTGRALSKKDAKEFAKKHGLSFFEGREIEENFTEEMIVPINK